MKKRVFSLVLALLVCAVLIPAPEAHAAPGGHGSAGKSVQRAAGIVLYLCAHRSSGFRCQILSLYSRIVRSDENMPDAAVLTAALCHHEGFS